MACVIFYMLLKSYLQGQIERKICIWVYKVVKTWFFFVCDFSTLFPMLSLILVCFFFWTWLIFLNFYTWTHVRRFVFMEAKKCIERFSLKSILEEKRKREKGKDKHKWIYHSFVHLPMTKWMICWSSLFFSVLSVCLDS